MKLIDYINTHDMAGRTFGVGHITVTCNVDGLDPFEYEAAFDQLLEVLGPWLECECAV